MNAEMLETTLALSRPTTRPDPGRPRLPLAPGVIESWTPDPEPLDPWLVLRLCRYRRRDAVPPPIWDAACAMAARGCELAAPEARIVAARVAATGPGGVRIEAGPTFSGRAVGTLLAECPLAAAFVLTLGPRLEAEAAALAERREPLEAFLLDTAGWAAIEVAVRALRRELAARARAVGWRVTHRLAPGYLDWPLEEQPALVGLFGPGAGLVRLSPAGLLVPFKSISGLFGLAPAAAGSPA